MSTPSSVAVGIEPEIQLVGAVGSDFNSSVKRQLYTSVFMNYVVVQGACRRKAALKAAFLVQGKRENQARGRYIKQSTPSLKLFDRCGIASHMGQKPCPAGTQANQGFRTGSYRYGAEAIRR